MAESRPCANGGGPGVQSRSAVLRGSSFLLTESQSAEALVEARDLAAFRNLASSANPGRMDLGIDVEVKRVAFLAPGRTDLELGAVGHFDVDHVVVGVNTGLHLIFP